MNEIDDEFIGQLRTQFAQDTLDLLLSIEATLLSLEKNVSSDKVTELKRHLHCLKGNAKAVGFDEVSRLVHEAESRCDQKVDQTHIDHMLGLIDRFRVGIETFLSTANAEPLIQFKM